MSCDVSDIGGQHVGCLANPFLCNGSLQGIGSASLMAVVMFKTLLVLGFAALLHHHQHQYWHIYLLICSHWKASTIKLSRLPHWGSRTVI